MDKYISKKPRSSEAALTDLPEETESDSNTIDDQLALIMEAEANVPDTSTKEKMWGLSPPQVSSEDVGSSKGNLTEDTKGMAIMCTADLKFAQSGTLRDILPSHFEQPVCCKCGMTCELARSQFRGTKNGGTWKCNACNTKAVLLSRSLGSFPTPEFKELSEEAQRAFWRDCPVKGSEKIKAFFVNTVVEKMVEKRMIGVGGSYLPLSVYKTQGYDIDDIQQRCKDKRTHPVLGEVYTS